ncbi:MAG: alpha/beta hydrolase [Acetobacteraceae bacterium]|nr:alpha/beta hydrolase [Acetobacteraceae bacterium]
MRYLGSALGRRAALTGASLLAACSPAGLLNATVPRRGLTVERDVAYGSGPRQRMDIYRPADASSDLPLIVFFYGGSWRSGSKAMYPFVTAPLARRGAVVAVPDYRLYPEVIFPAFLEDCAAAVAFAAANAARWGADPRRLVLLGHSAGAYNAAMLLLDPRLLAAAGAPRPAGGALLAGPYDFLPITDPDIVPVFPDAGPQTQPITYADGRNPPLLLLASGEDRTVKPRNTVALAERIRGAGGPVEAQVLPGLGHIGIVLTFAPLFHSKAPMLDLVWEFVGRVAPFCEQLQ